MFLSNISNVFNRIINWWVDAWTSWSKSKQNRAKHHLHLAGTWPCFLVQCLRSKNAHLETTSAKLNKLIQVMKKDRPNWFRLSPCSFLPWYPHPLSLALHTATTKVWWGTVAPRHFQMDQVFFKKMWPSLLKPVNSFYHTGEGKSNWCNFSTTRTKSVILLCQCKIHVTFSTKINYAYLVAGGCA